MITITELKYHHKDLYSYIVNKLTPIIDNKKSTLRLRMITEDVYGYSEEPTKDIIKYTFIIIIIHI